MILNWISPHIHIHIHLRDGVSRWNVRRRIEYTGRAVTDRERERRLSSLTCIYFSSFFFFFFSTSTFFLGRSCRRKAGTTHTHTHTQHAHVYSSTISPWCVCVCVKRVCVRCLMTLLRLKTVMNSGLVLVVVRCLLPSKHVLTHTQPRVRPHNRTHTSQPTTNDDTRISCTL